MTIKTAIVALAPSVYWELADAAGTAIAADSSGNARPGTYSGAFSLGQPGPEVGSTAVLFTGNGVLSITGNVPFTARPFSMFTWVAGVQLSNANTGIIAINDPTFAARGCILNVTTGGLTASQFSVIRPASGTTAFTNFIPDNAWHYVGVTFDAAGNLLLYYDGLLLSSPAGVGMNNLVATDKFRVGGNNNDIYYFAHAAFWNSILTAAQIQSVVAGRINPQSPGSVFALTTTDVTILQQILNSVRKVY